MMNGLERLEYWFGMFDWNVGEAFRVAINSQEHVY
jgi:hypothetical protein